MKKRVVAKQVKKSEKGELSQHILRLVDQVGKEAGGAAPVVQIINFFGPKDHLERNRIWKAIKYLETQNRLALTDRQGEAQARLTNSGKHRLSEDAIWNLRLPVPESWDGQWRFVMFDIPMKLHRGRALFKEKLVDFGLMQYQQSVYIFPYDCESYIRGVADYFGVNEYVRTMVSHKIDREEEYMKAFGLH